ncbi:MAG: hypothetical protein C0501_00330 [Isosphaera sp.]|nr:hypothetical protein [Isosphaera sp.]
MSLPTVVLALAALTPAADPAPRHAVVFHEKGTFPAWPANVGLWSWDGGKEAVVGFVTGKYVLRGGHNVAEPYANRLARTTDGGKTWAVEKGDGFYQPGTPAKPLHKGIDFTADGFALRVVAEGYQGGGPGTGVFVVSTDRGKTWDGPFALPRLLPDKPLGGRDQVTARTDTAVLGAGELLLMGSARPADRSQPDRAFAARLTAGGKEAEFLAWLQPDAEKHRTLMPSTVARKDGTLVTAVRVRQAGGEDCWVDAYTSADKGKTWSRLGKVGDTGRHNGNPPALAELADGRLCCAYGDRSRQKLFARVSADGGRTWRAEVVLRDEYQPDPLGDVDFGYPRMFRRPDGDLTVVYYWADADRPTGYIAATSWTPPAR